MRFRSVKHVRWYVGTTIFLVLLHVIGVLKPVERAVQIPATWIAHSMYERVNGVRITLANWRGNADAKDALSALTRERDELKARIALVEAENGTLRRQLAYPEHTAWRTVGADVIAKTTDITEQALLINRGSADGIQKDQVVFAEAGVLVGRIARVEEHRAVVRLLNDRQSRIGAILSSNNHAIGIVEGGYGLGVRLTLVPPEEVVSAHDILVTNAVDEQMPAGLLIGKVVTVGRETYEPFQHALVEPAIPYEQVKNVLVILAK